MYKIFECHYKLLNLYKIKIVYLLLIITLNCLSQKNYKLLDKGMELGTEKYLDPI